MVGGELQVLVRVVSGRTLALALEDGSEVRHLKERLFMLEAVPHDLQVLRCNGRFCADTQRLAHNDSLSLSFSLPGGKGGFGSLLRGANTKVGQKKTDNFSSCRDLNGRRLRHVDDEKKLEEFKHAQDQVPADKASVQRKFREIKTGEKTEFRMCKFARECKYQHTTCRYRHPEADVTSSTSESVKRDRDESASRPLELAFGGDMSERISDAVAVGLRRSKQRKLNGKAEATVLDANGSSPTVASPSSIEKPLTSNENKSSPEHTDEPLCIDLTAVCEAADLEAYGMERLKAELTRRRLKCGGTLQQRAERLFMLKSTPLHLIPAKHRAKSFKLKQAPTVP